MITRLLVANRGEIARRVFRTCRDLGIETVAVFSDPDEGMPHVTEADFAVNLPGSAPADTYLRIDLLVAAAHSAGADAVHPGYGFLSESCELAEAVIHAGLVWVGPPPRAIEAMGSKVAAKRLMAKAGVPVLAELDPAAITAGDLPVIVKASAGGGGRGMRIVHDIDQLMAEVDQARTEARSAFGDGTVFCEPYVRSGRHIEVQILADDNGTVWALPERDCSVQRRHQKVVEETPSPAIDDTVRKRLAASAVAAARAVSYVGAGTVEFLVTTDGRYHFLEMNTRLQVEHPVTECVTGLDLVAWQIQIAEGAPLPAEPPAAIGHAVEARLYAEDPAADWRPQSGLLRRFRVAADVEFTVPQRYGVRVDSAVMDGCVVGVHYDPLLAKVVAWAPDRPAALRRLAAALARAQIHGLTTNRDLLVRVLRHPVFRAGDAATDFFSSHGVPSEPLADDQAMRWSAVAAALAESQHPRGIHSGLPSGWRNVMSAPQRRRYDGGVGQVEVAYRRGRNGLELVGPAPARIVSAAADRVVLDRDGVRHTYVVAAYPGLVCVDSAAGPVTLAPVERFPEPTTAVAPGTLIAPMPGAVSMVHVSEGEVVAADQLLVTLEAMKMMHPVTAPAPGTVTSVAVGPGTQVQTGTVLVVVAPAGPSPDGSSRDGFSPEGRPDGG